MAGTASYSELVQTVRSLHPLSDVSVGAETSYCAEVHCETTWQRRSEVDVGGAASNSSWSVARGMISLETGTQRRPKKSVPSAL